jgi:hypothetical protein
MMRIMLTFEKVGKFQKQLKYKRGLSYGILSDHNMHLNFLNNIKLRNREWVNIKEYVLNWWHDIHGGLNIFMILNMPCMFII